MADCLFCKIVNGDIPATIIRSTDEFVAFRDINPQAPSHVLVIPKRHVRSLNELTDADLGGGLLLFARDVAEGEGLAEDGFRLVFNTNGNGGQTVWHLHGHILGGRVMQWPPG